MRTTSLLLHTLLLYASCVQGQDTALSGTDPELAQGRQLVDQLRLEYGHMDYRLLEPLAAYADQLLRSGQFDETHDVLDQATQIVKLHEGLYTPNQFPFLLAKVNNYANRGDWYHARQLMEHLRWLLARQENTVNENLIASLLELTDLHLRGVAEDNPLYQGFHFRAALEPNRLAVIVAQNTWGRYDPRLAPLLYKLTSQHYLHAHAVDLGGKTAAVLRTYTGSGATRSRFDSRQNSYYLGLRYLNEIQSIFLNQEQPALDAIALSDMYLADWHVLFGDPEAARQGYARSVAGLQQAGITPEAINQFFAHPVVLPAREFFADWDSASASASGYQQFKVNAQGEPPVLLSFSERSASMPFMRAPSDNYNVARAGNNPDETAIFTFRLSGLDQFSRWNQGRYKTVVSAAQDLRMLQHNFSQAIDTEGLHEQVSAIRFRPKLIDGVPQSVDATLHYHSALVAQD